MVFSRHKNEQVIIDLRVFGLGLVTVTLVDIRSKDKVRIGIEADASIVVHRREVFDRVETERQSDGN